MIQPDGTDAEAERRYGVDVGMGGVLRLVDVKEEHR
jgi:hypothetical protein